MPIERGDTRDAAAPIWTIKCSCGWGTSALSDHDAVDRHTAHAEEREAEHGR